LLQPEVKDVNNFVFAIIGSTDINGKILRLVLLRIFSLIQNCEQRQIPERYQSLEFICVQDQQHPH